MTRIVGLWLALPFVMLSLIAPGYMPVQADNGSLTMVICSDGMAVEVSVDLATGQPVSKQQSPQDGRCSWAQAAQAAVLMDGPAVTPPQAMPRSMVAVAPDDLWQPAYDPRGLWARGPPSAV